MRATYPVHRITFNVLTLTLSSFTCVQIMKLSISDFLNPVTSCLSSKCIPQPSVLKHLQPASLVTVLSPKAHTPFRQILLDIEHALIHLRDTNSQNGVSTFLRSRTWVSKVRLYYRLVTTFKWYILFQSMICNLKL
jgi:hypothetical protein